jgi:hypothetical protein
MLLLLVGDVAEEMMVRVRSARKVDAQADSADAAHGVPAFFVEGNRTDTPADACART